MECLEQPGAFRVETAEAEVTKLYTKLFGKDETGIDNLTLFAVTERTSVLGSSDGILDGTEDLGNRPQAVVTEALGLSETKDGVPGQGRSQGRPDLVLRNRDLRGNAKNLRGAEVAREIIYLNLCRHGSPRMQRSEEQP
jgi:hypothetical protein